MITIQAEFTQKQCDLGLIGRVGENASRQIVFDCAEALRAFPGADILCIYQRPGEGAPYLAPLSGEKGVYTLVLADTDVALPGFARMELRAEKGGKIVKSAYFTGEIAPALRAPGERPDAADRIAALLAQAQQRLDELAWLTGQSVKWESIADKPGLAPSLALKDGQLAVVTAAAAEQDNPLPITSAAVHAQLGQVNALLASI